jgi:hypothetical protein
MASPTSEMTNAAVAIRYITARSLLPHDRLSTNRVPDESQTEPFLDVAHTEVAPDASEDLGAIPPALAFGLGLLLGGSIERGRELRDKVVGSSQ